MAGMFDFFAGPQAAGISPEARQGIGQQSMLALASALLQAGGPSARPVSFGQALGSALPGVIQAQQQGMDRARQQSIFDLQKRDLDRRDAEATQNKMARDRLVSALQQGGTDMGRPVDMKPLWAQAFPDQFASSEFAKLAPKPLIGVPEGGLYDPNKGQVVVQGTPKTPPDVQAYQFAQSPAGGGFKGSFEDWMQAKANGGQETYGNTPVWGTDAQGNPVIMQPSNRGGLRVAQMPPGVTPQRGQTSRVDLGTQWGVLDANGGLIGYLPKDVAGAAKQEVIGKGAGTAEVDTIKKGRDATNIMSIIDGAEDLIKKSTGSYGGAAVNELNRFFGKSTPGATAIAELKILQGNLVANMPRMEGPQSNYDVEMYKDNAARIADPTIPRDQRIAALQVIRRIAKKYQDRAQPGAASGPNDLKAMSNEDLMRALGGR